MSTTQPSPEERAFLAQMLNRRRFLSLLGGAGAVGVIGCSSAGSSARSSTQPPTADSMDLAADDNLPVPSSAADPQRQLSTNPNRRIIVIELSGGNDGLAMLQPYDDGILRDRRPDLIADDAELLDTGSGFGWHPALSGLVDLGIAGAVGVGSNDPDFSHFEMEQRWWRGVSEDNSRVSTGFFGRLCDQLDVGDPVTGLSFSGGPTQALAAEKAVTVGLTEPGISWFFNQDEAWFNTLRETHGAMAAPSPDDSERFVAARGGLADTLRFAESLSDIPESDGDVYPWTDLGQQLRFAAEVLDLDDGVRVMHVRQGGYDTHSGQEWRHRELMAQLNDATVAFINDITDRGLRDDTLIVTTSEFGRRVPENDNGTDHGGASTMLVSAAGSTGIYGDAPSLNQLDDGNVVATARFEDYYATIAEDWFGVPVSEVLPTGGTPIAGLL